ncbi:hypothetical protein AMTR_s00003p00227060 [Amborella trichopoda]|uniref:Uncharacterized protein n=1 Tax=Amborella trichopoda TaxID=13333 RepID=W1P8I4_AMBTC|nr:hypothetical protein AMTR_s00003p00227060 [Amborella trichopoda]
MAWFSMCSSQICSSQIFSSQINVPHRSRKSHSQISASRSSLLQGLCIKVSERLADLMQNLLALTRSHAEWAVSRRGSKVSPLNRRSTPPPRRSMSLIKLANLTRFKVSERLADLMQNLLPLTRSRRGSQISRRASYLSQGLADLMQNLLPLPGFPR